MENQKEETILKGRIGVSPEISERLVEGANKKVAAFTVARTENNVTVWQNVQIWENKFPENFNIYKKGDEIELKGYLKNYVDSNKKQQTEFVVKEVINHLPIQTEKIQIKGNLGIDPIIQTLDNGKKVAKFSVGVRSESKESKWYNIHVWEKNIEKFKIQDLKHGDFVEIHGKLGKEYVNQKNEKARDIQADEVKILKTSIELNEKKKKFDENVNYKKFRPNSRAEYFY